MRFEGTLLSPSASHR